MATSQQTAEYIVDQLASLEHISTRKMFGEYALYYEGKVVALICDNTLYIKMTTEGKSFVDTDYKEGAPYPGAKPWIEIGEEKIEDRTWLTELIEITFDALPAPKLKKKK